MEVLVGDVLGLPRLGCELEVNVFGGTRPASVSDGLHEVVLVLDE